MAGVKGQSGRKANEQVFRHAIMERLDELDPRTDRKKLYAIANKLTDLALDGDMQAIREIMDRVDGKPKQTAEVTGANGEDLSMRLIVEKIVVGRTEG